MARLNTPPATGTLPGWTWVPNDTNTGGTYTARHWRIVLHSTEFTVVDTAHAARVAAVHNNPPHLWFGWGNDGAEIRLQTIPLDRSARALLQPAGGTPTNKAGALQVELFGHAAALGALTDSRLRRIAEAVIVPLAEWAAANGSTIELASRPLPGPGPADGRYGVSAQHRMGVTEWVGYRGVCCHYDVVHNSHWDTGTLDVPRIIHHAQTILNGDDDVPVTADEIEAIAQRANEVRVEWENAASATAAAGGTAPSASLAGNRVWAKGYHAASREAADAATAAVNARADEILAAIAQLAADIRLMRHTNATVTTVPPEVIDQIRAALVAMLTGGIDGLNT